MNTTIPRLTKRHQEYTEALDDVTACTSLDVGWHRVAYERYRSFLGLSHDRIIELGCGTGIYTIACAQDNPRSRCYGLDILYSSAQLCTQGAKKRGLQNVYAVQGDIENLPFKEALFTGVFNEGVLEHFTHYERTFAAMSHILKPGGMMLISVPNFLCFPHTLYKFIKGKKYENYFERSFTHAELNDLLKKNNFDTIEFEGFYPMYGIARLSRYFRPLWRMANIIEATVVRFLDILTRRWFSRTFGFFIMIKGVKKRD